MISFILLLLLSFVLVCCLVIKLVKIKLTSKLDTIICVVLPALTLAMFIAMLIECNIRREKDIIILNDLITIVEKSFSTNRIFISNNEKKQCQDSLLYFDEQLNNLAHQDSLITIIYGESPYTQTRISKAKEAIAAQLKRINRLNNLLDTPIQIDSKQQVNNIHMQEPFTKELPTMNFIFSCRNIQDSVVAIQVTVIRSDSIIYTQQYEYNPVNSVTIPHVPGSKEKVELGYIIQKGNKNNYNYIIYGE